MNAISTLQSRGLRASSLILLSFSMALLMVACGPAWRVVRQSGPPSALATVQAVGVSFDWSTASLGGMSEGDWLATQPPEDQQAYFDVKAAIEASYLNTLSERLEGIQVQAANGSEANQVIVHVNLFEMGYYRVMVARPSRLSAIVSFVAAGTVTDEIEIKAEAAADLYHPAIITRMQSNANRLAQLTAQFVGQARSRN